MTNVERGEVDLTVDNAKSKYHGRSFTLKLSLNAAVAVERKTKKRIGQLIAEAGLLGFEAIRSLLWLLLQKHHADEFKTEEAAGDLLDDAGIGTFETALAMLSAENKPDAPEGGDGNPREAQASGTGESSTSQPGASA